MNLEEDYPMDLENDFFSLNSNELLSLSMLVAILFANNLNNNQLNIFGNFLTSVAQNILLIQAVISTNPNPNAIYTICPNNSSSPESTSIKNNDSNSITATQFTELESKLNELIIKVTEIESTFKKAQDCPYDNTNTNSD